MRNFLRIIEKHSSFLQRSKKTLNSDASEFSVFLEHRKMLTLPYIFLNWVYLVAFDDA